MLYSTVCVTDAHILSYFSVFYTDLFDEVFVFESLSLDMIRWLVTCCHHVHSQSHVTLGRSYHVYVEACAYCDWLECHRILQNA